MFIDETAASTRMARRYGWALRGQRCRLPMPYGHYKTTAVTAALRTTGLTATTIVEGATTRRRCLDDVTAVWYGNDDHSSTKNMTGGSLPAMTFHKVMAPAHQGIEMKPLPGFDTDKVSARTAQAAAPTTPPPGAPAGALSRRSFEVLGGLGQLFRSVESPRPGRAAFNVIDRPGSPGSSSN
ncbi:hypothetical protein QR79_10710 [Methylobacterium indicum]|uniref:Tc1-like transposase DDE domain-containing protein n=1 Tax=Methylobacterium indicum TaxID=1775910 RepID=A0ABR5HEC7_9HYPH|nr:hypothetical protein QR79_10710 [Methylobacterium indicum]